MSLSWNRFDWNTIDEKLPQLLTEVEDILHAPEGVSSSDIQQGRTVEVLNIARTEVDGLIKDPMNSKGFWVREKVANAASTVAVAVRNAGGSVDQYIRLANVAFELYFSMRRNERYARSLTEMINLFLDGQLKLALPQHPTDITEVEREIRHILRGAYRKDQDIPSAIMNRALERMWQAYGDERDSLERESQFGVLSELLEHLLPLVVHGDIPSSLKEEKEKWLEAGQRYTPKVMQALIVSGQGADTGLVEIPDKVKEDVRVTANRGDQEMVVELLRGITSVQAEQLRQNLGTILAIKIPEMPRNLEPKVYQVFKVGANQLQARNYLEAARTLDQVWKSNVLNSALMGWSGCALALAGQPEQAKNRLKQAYRTGDTEASTLWNLACLEFRSQQNNETFQYLQQLIRMYPGDEKIVAATLGVALSLGREDFLIEQVGVLPGTDFLPLGVVLAHEKGDWDKRNQLIMHLLQVWSSGSESDEYAPPPPERKITAHELEEVYTHFVATGRIPAGIGYFEARVKNFPRFHANLQFLGNLYLMNDQVDEALKRFFPAAEMTMEARIPDVVKQDTWLRLLELCARHNRNAMGGQALAGAKRAGASEFKLRPYREKFGIQEGIQQEPVRSAQESSKPPQESFVTEEGLKAKQQALADVASLGGQMGGMRTVAELGSARASVSRYLGALRLAYPDEVRSLSRLFSNINRMLDLLAEFQSTRDFPQRKGLADRILEVHREIREIYDQQSDPRNDALKQTMKGFMGTLKRVIADCGYQVGFVPELVVEPLTKSIPEDDIKSSLVLRVTNPSEQVLSDVRLEVRSEQGVCRVVSDAIALDEPLQPRGSAVCLVPIHRDQSGTHESFTVQLRFSTAELTDIQPTKVHKFNLGVKEFPSEGLPQRYVIGQAVPANRPLNFQGRDEVLSQILRSLGSGGPQSAVRFLDGLRRVGKTSVLNALTVQVPANVIPVMLDMDELSPDAPTATSARFLHQISKAIEEGIEKKIELKVEAPSFAELEKDLTLFNDYIKQVCERLPDHRVLLVFDEFQRVLRGVLNNRQGKSALDETPLNMFRSHLRQGNLLCVFTGSLKFYQLRSYVDHPLLGTLLPLAISFIAKDAVANVLQLPVRDINVQYPDETADLVWRLTAGYPWLVQAIAHECLRRLNDEHRWVVAPGDIEAIVAEEILPRDNYFEWWWDTDQLAQREADIVESILRHQKQPGEGVRAGNPLANLLPTMDRQSLTESLTKLIDLEVLAEAGGMVHIKALLLERWLSKRMQTRGGRLIIQPRSAPQTEVAKVPARVMIAIDHENLFLGLKDEYARRGINLNELLPQRLKWIIDHMLAQAQKYGEIDSKSKVAVAVWDTPEWIRHMRSYADQGFSAVLPEQFKGAGDQVADFKLQGQIWDLLTSSGSDNIGTVILVSGDHHFKTVARDLRNNRGKRVVVWGVRNHTDAGLREFAGEDFAWLPDLLEAEERLA